MSDIIQRKPNVLWVSEASFLNTGFSTLSKGIMERIFPTFNYHLYEYGSYAKTSDPRGKKSSWPFFGSVPEDHDQAANQAYHNSAYGQFGETLFEEVCLQTRPDIVVLSRDYWMDTFFLKSPFRKNFKVIWMPTVDGSPQKAEWIDNYKRNVDLLLTYSEYGKKTLENHDPNIKVSGVGRPGVDHTVFKPMDKKALRHKHNIPQDAFIINTTMRNQKRKLFPDLIEMFSEYLKYCIDRKDYKKANNTYLYLHTSYPDVGFDIPRHIMQNGVGHRVIMTYYCSDCNNFNISNFMGEICTCPKCGRGKCHMPNTGSGVDRDQLCEIYNMADLYIQYSICLHPDEEISLDSGWTPIKDVKIGDMALTHDGTYQEVLDTFENQSNHLNEIAVHADYETLKITDTHPVYSWSKNEICPSYKRSLREHIGLLISNDRDLPEFKFTSVEDLKEGDLIAQPIDDSVADIERMDLAPFAKDNDLILDNFIEVKSGNTYPRFIDIDEEFCQLIGLFAADGHSQKNNSEVRISCNKNEIVNKNVAYSNFSNITKSTVSIRKYKDRNAIDVSCCSSLLTKAFRLWFKRHQYKQLPDWTSHLPLNKQKKIIHGMFMGDGCESDKYKNGVIDSIYCTISKKLADQLKFMLERCRIPYNCSKVIKKCNDNRNRKPQYTFHIKGRLKTEFSPELGRRSSRGLYYKNYIIKNIKSIEKIEYNGMVNNIEVENNNSYISRLCCIKNCEGLGMPIAEAKACGIPAMGIEYSATAEQVSEAVGCQPIKVGQSFHESVLETEQIRCLPDNKDAIKKIYQFFSKSVNERDKLGQIAQKDAVDNYSYDRSAKVFMDAIDSLDYDMTQESTWMNPEPNLLEFPDKIPQFRYASELVDWCFENILKRTDLKYSYFKNQLIKGLNTGVLRTDRDRGIKFGYNECLKKFEDMVNKHNYYEHMRMSLMLGKTSQKEIWSTI